VSATETRPRTSTMSMPVRWWASLGALGLGAELLVLGVWSADAGWRPPKRPDHVPSDLGGPAITGVFVGCWALLVILPLAIVVCRDCLRRRSLTFAAVVMVAAPLSSWLDMLSGWHRPVFVYYTDDPLTIRGWSPHLPGWHGGEQLAYPAVPVILIYYVSLPLGIFIMKEAIGYAARRRPDWGTCRLFAVSMLVSTVGGGGLLFVGVATRLFAFVDVVPDLTLFYGTRFQYPVYDAVLNGVCFAAFGALWYRLDEHGLSAVERGVDQLPSWCRPWVRVLSMTGAIQLALLCFGIGNILLSLVASPAPPLLDTPVLSTAGP
jgi:hypothetical protein